MGRIGRQGRDPRPRKAGAKRTGGAKSVPAPAGDRSLQLWRAVHERVLQQQADTHLQGLYAELGKLYFEQLRGAARPTQHARSQAEELSARISAFRLQRRYRGPRPAQAPAGGRRSSRRRGGTA